MTAAFDGAEFRRVAEAFEPTSSINAALRHAATLADELARYQRVGWAQKLVNKKWLFMETDLPKEALHDNGREMLQLFILKDRT